MSRVLKFQAILNGERIDDVAPFTYAGRQSACDIIDHEVVSPFHEPPQAVIQFTGLHNNDGIELYEDDLVHRQGSTRVGRIVYEVDGFVVDDGETTVYLSSCYRTLKVLGNYNIDRSIFEQQ